MNNVALTNQLFIRLTFLHSKIMKSAIASLTKYFQKTVAGTQKYVVASDFPQQILEERSKATCSEIPSRQALKKHKYYLHLPTLTLPYSLDLAATDCLREHNVYAIKHLKQLSTRLVNYLHERELLTEVRLYISKNCNLFCL